MNDWAKTQRELVEIARSLRIAGEDLEQQVLNVNDPTDEQTAPNADTLDEIVEWLRIHANTLSAINKNKEK